jgi:hypothetical protein
MQGKDGFRELANVQAPKWCFRRYGSSKQIGPSKLRTTVSNTSEYDLEFLWEKSKNLAWEKSYMMYRISCVLLYKIPEEKH